MGCCSSPSPPDPVATAQAQGAANEAAARTQGRINNPNVYGPWGSQTVTWDGDTPTLTQTLSDIEQQIYDADAQNRLGLGSLANQGIGSLSDLIGSAVDFGGAPGMGSAFQLGKGPETLDYARMPSMRSAFTTPTNLPDMPGSSESLRSRVIDAMMGRANERFAQQEDQTNSDLIARGIRPGTEAYAREMERIDQAKNDAYQQAEIGASGIVNDAYNQDLNTRQQAWNEATQGSQLGFGQQQDIYNTALAAQGQRFGQQATAEQLRQSGQGQQFGQQGDLRRQFISELLAQRQTPLNEISALMSGSQVNNPFSMPGYAQNAQVQPAPIASLIANNYNQQVGSRNNAMSGLFGLGSAFMGGWGR